MPKHDFVPNGLNDYCLTCDLPRYSAVHEAVEFIDVTTLATNRYIIDSKPDHADAIRIIAQEKAKRLGDLIYAGRIAMPVYGTVKLTATLPWHIKP